MATKLPGHYDGDTIIIPKSEPCIQKLYAIVAPYQQNDIVMSDKLQT
jgi:hypothetical protein